MNKMIWITLSYLILLPSSQAASFDCAKAKTNVETIICSDAGLSKLDEELSSAYKTLLNKTQHQDVIKNAQRFWQKRRDACGNAECLRQSYEERLSKYKADISASESKGEIGRNEE